MKLATLARGGPDGALVVVSADGSRGCAAAPIAATLQAALEDWTRCEPALRELARQLERGGGTPLADAHLAAPLPRAWQWLDASVYPAHAELLDRLFGRESVPASSPLMYQGMSHRFIGPTEDVPLPREADEIDFEGEFGIVTDAVPLGIDAAAARAHIRLIVVINDWSLRAYAAPEKRTGFGWILAKPACSMAPFAATPDELAMHWRDARPHLRLRVDLNGRRFGNADGGAMAYGFDELIAHAARTRELCAGTIIGSGTVANSNHHEVGSSCIAERRAIEMLETGSAQTRFMRYGDRVRIEATLPDGRVLSGPIDQRVVPSSSAA